MDTLLLDYVVLAHSPGHVDNSCLLFCIPRKVVVVKVLAMEVVLVVVEDLLTPPPVSLSFPD